MPVFSDWECASLVTAALDGNLDAAGGIEMSVLLVDDGSPEPVDPSAFARPEHLVRVEVLSMARNVGHQRAIAAGLCHLHDEAACDAVVVMDADGEDRPEDVRALIGQFLKASKPGIVFAQRRRRYEGMVFQIGYRLYRLLHTLMTGVSVLRVGNFSIVPFSVLHRLVTMSELWNHYAGAVFRSKLPFQRLPLDRGRRLRGQSKMNFVSLVSHGISSIASFQETVATRLLLITVAGIVLMMGCMFAVITARFTTELAIPGWATYTTGLLLVLMLLLSATAFSLVFTLIVSRSGMMTIPIRDYRIFVDGLQTICEREQSASRSVR